MDGVLGDHEVGASSLGVVHHEEQHALEQLAPDRNEHHPVADVLEVGQVLVIDIDRLGVEVAPNEVEDDRNNCRLARSRRALASKRNLRMITRLRKR